jgi:hypothetical protein
VFRRREEIAEDLGSTLADLGAQPRYRNPVAEQRERLAPRPRMRLVRINQAAVDIQ